MAARASAFSPQLFLLETYFAPYGIVFNPLLIRPYLLLESQLSSSKTLSRQCPATPDKVFALPFPSTLTTMALDQCSLRRFETSSCKPIPRGPPSSSMKHGSHLHYCDRLRSTQNGVAFPKMSRSIVTRSRLTRKRLISICSVPTSHFGLIRFDSFLASKYQR